MNRFFISPDAVSGTSVTIPEEVSAQIRRVLRLKEGTVVQFLDNSGSLYESAIHYLDEKHPTAEVLEKRPAEGEPEVFITLFIGLTQREKFEWILQKCTEAGVSAIVPVVTERSLIRKTSDNKKHRPSYKRKFISGICSHILQEHKNGLKCK